MIHITKVVSRNIIMDFVAQIRNLCGTNLKAYESMIDKGIKQIEDELKEKKIDLKWYRYEMSQLTNGAMMITLYGEEE